MKKIICLILCLSMCIGTALLFTGCGEDENEAPESLVIMSEALDGLFNPFFSTSGADSTIVAMTQIGMLTSKYEKDANGKESVKVAFGDDEAVVVKDYESKRVGDETVYTFVLKNGIKFSDGHPLTMEDVLFNLYVYLDPVYTGSATLYSVDIKGLSEYRTQQDAELGEDSDDLISETASKMAMSRIDELINLFKTFETSSQGKYFADIETMKAAIAATGLSSGYKEAISNDADSVTNAQLLADYERTLAEFKKELEADYVAAKDAFTEAPYKGHSEFNDEIFCFMYYEGYVTPEYAEGADGKKDKNVIKSFLIDYNQDVIKSKEDAIKFVYEDKVANELHIILQAWGTAQILRTEYAAKAREVLLHKNIENGQLKYPNIEGIVSLGHKEGSKGSTVTVNGNNYTVASAHNADGTVTNQNEYDILQITIDGVDPKAQWNFAFSVAPQHYYGDSTKYPVDIENNKFGVSYASFDFMTDVIQAPTKIKIPVGAGAYKATNRQNSDTPSTSDFYSDNVVYFKANNFFETVGAGINNAKIEKVRYQVVSSNNAIAALESGEVHYVTPQLTGDNYDKLQSMKNSGFDNILTDQLGYGYVGINAGQVPDINIRRAIMCAMNTAQAIKYYRQGTASQIYWPMSTVSWAHPTDDNDQPLKYNGVDYPQPNGTFNEQTAIELIQSYMAAANDGTGPKSTDLKITLTIAGSTLQDHPTYTVFRDAAALLNSLGWTVDVQSDAQALTKINTGSLQVWAAAWGSTIDPDLYQVYHKNSTATSTKAWGYDAIKTSGSAEEQDLLDDLSDLIDKARETLDEGERTDLYKDAMDLILKLAIELPVYQRSVVYAYNANVIDSSTLPQDVNPYSSPLDKIWEIDFAK